MLVQRAKSGDLHVSQHATWGMSEGMSSKKEKEMGITNNEWKSTWIKMRLVQFLWFFIALSASIVYLGSLAQAQTEAVIFEPNFVANATTDNYIEFVGSGGDLFVTGPDERTALHYAVRYGSAELVEHLVEVGLDVNKPNVYLNSPLHWAVAGWEDGAPESTMLHKVEILLAAGAEINALTDYNETPIMFAGTTEIAQILLDNGADINIIATVPGEAPVNAIEYNIRAGRLELADFLQKYSNQNLSMKLANLPTLDKLGTYLIDVQNTLLTRAPSSPRRSVLLDWEGQATRAFPSANDQPYAADDLSFLVVGDNATTQETFQNIAKTFSAKYRHWEDESQNNFADWEFLRLTYIDFEDFDQERLFALGAFPLTTSCLERVNYLIETIPLLASTAMKCLGLDQPKITSIEIFGAPVGSDAEEYFTVAGGSIAADELKTVSAQISETDLRVTTSFNVAETLSNGLRISDQADEVILDVCVNLNSAESPKKSVIQAWLATAQFKRLQAPLTKYLTDVGYSGSMNAIEISTCNGSWDIGEIALFLDNEDIPRNRSGSWTELGTLSLSSLVDASTKAETSLDRLSAESSQNYNSAKNMGSNGVVGIWLFVPEVYERHFTDGNDEGVFDVEICSYADVTYTQAYISSIGEHFDHLLSVLPANYPQYGRVDWRYLSDIENGRLFPTPDEMFSSIQLEVDLSDNFRNCDIVLAEASTGATIYDRMIKPRSNYQAAELMKRLGGLAIIGSPMSDEDLLKKTLELTGFASEERYKLSLEVNLNEPKLIDDLWANGYDTADSIENLLDDLAAELKRNAAWSDVTSFLDLLSAGTTSEDALIFTGEAEAERVRLAEEKARENEEKRRLQLEEKAKTYPYFVVFQCGFGDNLAPLAACFVGDVNTSVRVNIVGQSSEYNYFSFQSLGKLTDYELRFDLPAQFEIVAQNASDKLALSAAVYEMVSGSRVQVKDAANRFSTLWLTMK
jgi:ankyrin repeat protein